MSEAFSDPGGWRRWRRRPAGPFCRGAQYYTPDATGSIATVTDTSGNHIQHNQYGVFGQQLTDNQSSGNPLGFLGGMSDPNGLVNVGGMMDWSPGLGQGIGGSGSSGIGFLSVIGHPGGIPLVGGRPGDGCHLDAPEWVATLIERGVEFGALAGALAGGIGGGTAGAAGGPVTIALGAALGATAGAAEGGALGGTFAAGLATVILAAHHVSESCYFARGSGSGSGSSGSGSGPQFPGVDQGAQAPHDPTSPQFDPTKTPFDPRELPPGVTVDDALEAVWSNPTGGDINCGQIYGKPGYPVNSQGWEWLDVRVSKNGVHGWPIPGPLY